nr:toxin-antitoxin system HicB family antitoxin [Lentilactobacillus rapi]
MPEPVDESFSGRITLRMPKSLHKELTVLAKEENVSLNQYVVALLEHNTANVMRSAMDGRRQYLSGKDHDKQSKISQQSVYKSNLAFPSHIDKTCDKRLIPAI